jgi:hypothetical protein
MTMTTPEPHLDATELAEEALDRRDQRGDTDDTHDEVVSDFDLGR